MPKRVQKDKKRLGLKHLCNMQRVMTRTERGPWPLPLARVPFARLCICCHSCSACRMLNAQCIANQPMRVIEETMTKHRPFANQNEQYAQTVLWALVDATHIAAAPRGRGCRWCADGVQEGKRDSWKLTSGSFSSSSGRRRCRSS